MSELTVDSTPEEVKTKGEVREDRHNLRRSPTQKMHKHKSSKQHGINMDVQITIVKKTGETEDTTILDHMNLERGISQKTSPKRNGKWLRPKKERTRERKIG